MFNLLNHAPNPFKMKHMSEISKSIFFTYFQSTFSQLDKLANFANTTTKEGHIAIQISSQITKKSVSENLQFRTTIPRKLLSICETLTFALVQSQALRNS
jgi:hypothetical protein